MDTVATKEYRINSLAKFAIATTAALLSWRIGFWLMIKVARIFEARMVQPWTPKDTLTSNKSYTIFVIFLMLGFIGLIVFAGWLGFLLHDKLNSLSYAPSMRPLVWFANGIGVLIMAAIFAAIAYGIIIAAILYSLYVVLLYAAATGGVLMAVSTVK